MGALADVLAPDGARPSATIALITELDMFSFGYE